MKPQRILAGTSGKGEVMSQEQTESRNCGLSDRQIESALSRLLNGEPNTHEQTQAIVEMALRSLRSETGSRWVSTADRQPGVPK